MEKLKAKLADLLAAFGRLTEREKRMVMVAGVAVVFFVVFIVLYSFGASADRTKRRIADKTTKLAQVQNLATSFRAAEQVRQGVEQKLDASNIRLISYVEEKATAAGLDTPSMQPKADVALGDGRIVESSVEFTLTDVPLGRLVDFLTSIETGPGVVKVKYLRIEPRVANETLTAWVTVSTYKLKK